MTPYNVTWNVVRVQKTPWNHRVPVLHLCLTSDNPWFLLSSANSTLLYSTPQVTGLSSNLYSSTHFYQTVLQHARYALFSLLHASCPSHNYIRGPFSTSGIRRLYQPQLPKPHPSRYCFSRPAHALSWEKHFNHRKPTFAGPATSDVPLLQAKLLPNVSPPHHGATSSI